MKTTFFQQKPRTACLWADAALINTPLQRGGARDEVAVNRFSGFCEARQTAEAVQQSGRRSATPLKRGVNERGSGGPHTLAGFAPRPCSVFGLVGGILVAVATLAPAATDDLAATLQKGLFEEEANHNLDAAVQAYQSVASEFDKDRKLAATAIFRLGECYRKQGNTNGAVAQYQRVLRDFSDQSTLVTLSGQNLAGLGATPAAPATKNAAASAAAPAAPDQAEEVKSIQALIRDSPDLINAKDSQGRTPLHRAALNGQLVVATFLLDNGATVDPKDVGGCTPLHLAALRGHKDLVDLLLDHKADIQAAQNNGLTALHEAAERGFRSELKLLLGRGASVNAEANNRATPLHLAVASGFKAVAETLLSNGADVNATASDIKVANNSSPFSSAFYGTPLHIAAARGDQALAELLLASKADVNAKLVDGRTPLHLAAANGHAPVAALLLAHGAQVNARNMSGWTPLALAVENQLVLAAQALLAGKADPNSEFDYVSSGGTFSRSPLYEAVVKGDSKLVELLLRSGANPNAQSDSFTPLLLAVLNQKKELAGLLLQHKADPNIPDSQGRTPLHCAVAQPPVLELLLATKSDLNARTKDGETPLHLAASAGLKPAAELLLVHGANVNAQDNTGNTPLHLAVFSRTKELVDLLLANKADPNVRNREGLTPLDFARLAPGANWQERAHDIHLTRPGAPSSPSRFGPAPGLAAGGPNGREGAGIAAALKEHGAVEDLPDFSSIRITRTGWLSPQVVFRAQTNGLNRFTLTEAIAGFYQLEQAQANDGQNYNGSLPFPDFARIHLLRPDRLQPTKHTDLTVNLLNASNRLDCIKDLTLQFGDIVEIHEREHSLAAARVGLTEADCSGLAACLERKVTFIVKGGPMEVTLHCFEETSNFPRGFNLQTGMGVRRLSSDFYLSRVLKFQVVQNILRSSSDLSHIRVKRTDPDTRKARELQMDERPFLEGKAPLADDLWLRAGDIIEVPDKP